MLERSIECSTHTTEESTARDLVCGKTITEIDIVKCAKKIPQHLDDLGNNIAILYKKRSDKDFPIVTCEEWKNGSLELRKLHSALTDMCLAECAVLVGKKPKDIKKVAVTGFVTPKEAKEIECNNVMFKDIGNYRHGDYSHLIQLYLLKGILMSMKYSNDEIKTIYSLEDENGNKYNLFTAIFDSASTKQCDGDLTLAMHGDPSKLNNDLLTGEFSKEYPNLNGLKILESYVRHKDVKRYKDIRTVGEKHGISDTDPNFHLYIEPEKVEFDVIPMKSQRDMWKEKYTIANLKINGVLGEGGYCTRTKPISNIEVAIEVIEASRKARNGLAHPTPCCLYSCWQYIQPLGPNL